MARRIQHQRGVILISVVAVMLVLALALLVAKTGDFLAAKGKRITYINAAQERIAKALISYTSTYQRLPCPADPTGSINPGWANGDVLNNAVIACNYSTGVVPWHNLGLTQAEVTDEWGRLISYRVYDGETGLTQEGGASALDCDTNNGSTVNVAPTIAGLCDNTGGLHNTMNSATTGEEHFVTYNYPANPAGSTPSFNKGFTVSDFGTDVDNVAFVLISHGPTGLGGYTPSGARIPLPAITADDYNNTQADQLSFAKQATTGPEVVAGAANHFDDLVSYLPISDLLRYSNLDARDWPEETLPTFNADTTSDMTSPSTDATNPHFMSTGGGASSSNQEFTSVDSGTGVQAGLASGSYSACLWWPLRIGLVSESTRKFIAASVEFAATDNSGDRFPGFTLGFLSGIDAAGAPTNSTCGTSTAATTTATNTADSREISVASTAGIQVGMRVYGAGIDTGSEVDSISGSIVRLDQSTTGTVGTVSFADSRLVRRNLGWEGGSLSSYSNRFAAEVDMNEDTGDSGPPVVPTANDPAQPHVAIDFLGVRHGVNAGSCSPERSGLPCESEISDFPSVSRTATGSSGQNTITITDASGIAGIVHGMRAYGTGIDTGTRVTAISGNVVTLADTNVSNVSGSIFFDSVSTDNFMQNGLSVFHTARVEVYPKDCFQITGSGSSGSSTVSASSVANVEYGMSVFGSGIATGATVAGVSGSTITLSSPSTSAVSGTLTFGHSKAVTTNGSGVFGASSITVTNPAGISVGMNVTGTGVGSGASVIGFSGTTVTLSQSNAGTVSGEITFASAGSLTRTLVKSWTLSNAGCNADSSLCAALKSTSASFNADISSNRQVMHAVACVPEPTVADAYDSLYFGITTANRDNSGTALANVIFRALSVQTPSLQ